MKDYEPSKEYVRVAGIVPEQAVGSVELNKARIESLYHQAINNDVSVVVTPELALTGYTIGDLVHNTEVLDRTESALDDLRQATTDKNSVLVVGAPLRQKGSLYNCAVVIANGEYVMAVPKQFLPNQKEFYEQRWYRSGQGIKDDLIKISGSNVPFGTDQLFEVGDKLVGVEVCEDGWVVKPPHQDMALSGADIICNLSASPELVGKAEFRRNLVEQISARIMAGYVYVSAGPSESTTDVVMGGHGLIYENGKLVTEHEPFSPQQLFSGDLDVARCRFDRMQNANFRAIGTMVVRQTGVYPGQKDLNRQYNKLVFVPEGDKQTDRLSTILNIQTHGLIKAVEKLHNPRVVIGLSGGLDSTLALLVAVRAADALGIENKDFIHCLGMPSFASTERTQSNAQKLADVLGVSFEQIPIGAMSIEQLKSIDHDTTTQDVTYENTQARLRTALLFNYANKNGGLVLGTGDLSEIALGWCTYNGDHMSSYNVNASVPKTLVKKLVEFGSLGLGPNAKRILKDILDTPISPELVGDGTQINQSTEDIIGPYELHDFFLYHLLRYGESPAKINYLAQKVFEKDYSADQIEAYLKLFMERFINNQWKRQALPGGPKNGTVSLSPRGDWRMAPEISPSAIL